MVRIQCTISYPNAPWCKIFVPCLHHGSTRKYQGTVTMYHGIPLFTVIYHGCTMVVPWYFVIRVFLFQGTFHQPLPKNIYKLLACHHTKLERYHWLWKHAICFQLFFPVPSDRTYCKFTHNTTSYTAKFIVNIFMGDMQFVSQSYV